MGAGGVTSEYRIVTVEGVGEVQAYIEHFTRTDGTRVLSVLKSAIRTKVGPQLTEAELKRVAQSLEGISY